MALSGAADLPAPTEAGSQLEEITVTAQKRSERLQDVPISIIALTSSTMTDSGVRMTDDLPLLVPGLSMGHNSTAPVVFLRGIGVLGGQAGQEGPVAFFVDGVYQPSMVGSTMDLTNIERIEVLKGPQGTLYGRNATGGAINVVSKPPSSTSAMRMEVGYGNLHTQDVSFYGTTGIAPDIAADVALHYNNQKDGFGRNINTGEEVNKQKDLSIRSSALWDHDDTRIGITADFAHVQGDLANSYRPIPTSTSLDGEKGWSHGFWDTESEQTPFYNVTSMGISNRIEHDFSDFSLMNLAAYRSLNNFANLDLDGIALPLAFDPADEKDGQFTDEVQLSAKKISKLKWVLGAFYMDAYNKYNPWELNGGIFAPLYGIGLYDRQATKSYAGYGQATYEVYDRTNVTLGLRYTSDKRDLRATGFVIPAPGQQVITKSNQESATFNKPTWRFAIDHKFTDDIMAYTSYSRGFKSGIYNLSGPFATLSYDPTNRDLAPVVKPETLDDYELGMKTTLFDQKLRLNIGGFYYKYSNIQVQSIVNASQTLVNAANAKLYGADLDFDFLVVKGLVVSGGYEYNHARYTSFPNAPILVANPNPPYGDSTVNCAASPARCDASGFHMEFAPTSTASVSVNYQIPSTIGAFDYNLAARYSSSYAFVADGRLTQPAYGLLDTQLKWTTSSEKYYVRLWCKNLANKEYYWQKVESFVGDIGQPAPGRTFGIGFGVKLL